MATYFTNEGAFELPPGLALANRTVHVLDAELPSGEELNVLICRTKMPPETSLRDLVTKHVADDEKKLRGYIVIEETIVEIAGVPAIDVRSRWRHDGKVIYQRQAHLRALELWMLFGVQGPFSERETCDRALDRILTTLRLRDVL